MVRIVGFGAERIALPATASRQDVNHQRMVMLARCLNMRTTVAFIGSGCSIPLGYPTWTSLARDVAAATGAALERCVEPKYREARARIAQFDVRFESGDVTRTEDFLFVLGFCKRISAEMEQDGHGSPYADYLQRTFSGQHVSKRPTDKDHNPYAALLTLPISRFVTTNYDMELEHVLSRGDPAMRVRYELTPRDPRNSDVEPRWSFTQEDEYYDELSGFVLAGTSPRQQNRVFHCHGRFDRRESIVATEEDYQRWYLRDDVAGGSFRQNIQLLFGSNPVLFVGFGMLDNDLLYALRLLNADDPQRERVRSRSLFALMPEGEGDLRARDDDDFLLWRYGVHVIPYDPGRARTAEERGMALCRRLHHLRLESLKIRDDFFRKPAIRKVTVPAKPRQPYVHYAVTRRAEADLAPTRRTADLEELKKLIAAEGVVVVQGHGGSGKSWRVLDLLDEVRKERSRFDFDGVFFWSSYYADDWLTGLDRALVYLEPPHEAARRGPRLTRIERFRRCMGERHLLVFDGFERLLRQTGASTQGRVYSRVVEQLLEAAIHGRSTVVLTTRLMPDVLARRSDRVRQFAMRRLTTNELERGSVFGDLLARGLTLDDVSALCSLCDGHSYALALVAAYLGAGARADLPERLWRIRRKLSDVSPARRLSTMIRQAISDVVQRAGAGAKDLLERVAIFMSPATELTLDALTPHSSHQTYVQALADSKLVFGVSADPQSDAAPAGYIVHPTVRGVLFHEAVSEDPEYLPNFALAGFTSGNDPVHPGSPRSVAIVKKAFVSICDAADAALEDGDPARARELCRSAFGVMRSRMEANTAARWTTYDDYLNRGIRLANLVKRLAPSMWDYMERSYAHGREDPQGPLYADELAWLWNDIGLAFYAQGAIADSYAVWELGYEIDRVTDTVEEGGQYIVQSRMEMTGVFLEMGKLDTAGEYLDDTERSNHAYGDQEYAGRITGYKALLAHLRNNLHEAGHFYDLADTQLADCGRNLRGRSIFAQHYADLKISERDYTAAEKLVEKSIALAEEGNHRDLVAYARNSRAHLLRVLGRFREAQFEYDAVLSAAREIGIRRLESDVLSELGRLALELGDWETARARGSASLVIANELWLGLRRTHGLIILGLSMVRARNPQLGAAYLRHAHQLAITQGYLLRAKEAEAVLREIGEPVRR